MNPSPLASPAIECPDVQRITEALARPFDRANVKFKPQMVKNNRALAMAYVDARSIQDRLDEVLGVENWQDVYKLLPDGSVMCRLKLQLGGRWITKMDVGSPSEQPDSGDRLKAAFSDALKRAAVKFGIGRYLYRFPAQWLDYDPVRKQFTQTPQLPAFAIPAPATPAKAPAKPSAEAHALPSNGEELQRRLSDYDAKLAARKVCSAGALLGHVAQAGVKAGFSANLVEWNGPAIPFAVNAVREFEQSLRGNPSESPSAA